MNLLGLPKRVWGWAMYDFANSAYATCVLSVVFSVYFAKDLVPDDGILFLGMRIPGESLWGYLNSLVMAFVILFSPGIGALADRRGSKRQFLIFFAGLGAVSTIFLFGAKPGLVFYGFFVCFIATFGYEMSLIFYNAFLNDIIDDPHRGRVSGFGFALGYIGGGLCLAINLYLIRQGDPSFAVRMSLIVVGLWWLVFSLPAFLWLRDSKGVIPPEAGGQGPLRSPRDMDSQGRQSGMTILSTTSRAFHQLKTTLVKAGRTRDVGTFLLAYVIYNDGIQTVILMASIFGAKALGMTTNQLALCFLLIQFVAFWGAMTCGRWADAWGHRNVVLMTLAIYAGVIVWAIFMRSPWEFWILGVVVGFVLGGSQSATRSLYSLLIPEEQAGEFFALYAVVGKAAALIGPFVFGGVAQFWGMRAGVASLLAFFVGGGALLLKVPSLGVKVRQ